jgi:hypothetical protein
MRALLGCHRAGTNQYQDGQVNITLGTLGSQVKVTTRFGIKNSLEIGVLIYVEVVVIRCAVYIHSSRDPFQVQCILVEVNITSLDSNHMLFHLPIPPVH